MPEMTEEELEAAVAHDIKILEEHCKEMGTDPYADHDELPVALEARCKLVEAHLEAKVEAVRADLMRWTLLLFCAAALFTALLRRV